MAEGTRGPTDADPFVVRTGAAESGGERVRLELTLGPAPGSDRSRDDLPHGRWLFEGSDEHVHPEQEETIEVLTGEIRVVLAGDEHTLTEGDEMTLPRDVPHRHWNPTDRPARIVQERRPALRTDEFAETLFTLAQAGRTDDDGTPGFLQLAVIADEFPDDTYPTVAPVGVQKALFAATAPIGRLAGYEATYSREDVEDLR
ncbi:cupin domain-containing protein [Halobacteriales archaeon QS_4_69_31]|nr:MAG: cupin domain-containing protein [Halobacteriales archaeon QS_4_69_31]